MSEFQQLQQHSSKHTSSSSSKSTTIVSSSLSSLSSSMPIPVFLQYWLLRFIQLPSQLMNTTIWSSSSSRSYAVTTAPVALALFGSDVCDSLNRSSTINNQDLASSLNQRHSTFYYHHYIYGDSCHASNRLMTNSCKKGSGVGKKESTFEMLYSISSASFTYPAAAEDGTDFVI